jgi:hypothetical protein
MARRCVAFADPVLRTGGLQGDRYEDAVAFFGQRDDEAHYILCSCHAGGETTSTRAAAARVRETARWRRDVGLCLAVASLIFGSAVTATIVGYTVLHEGAGPARAVVLAEIEDGRRALAVTHDAQVVAQFERDECCGATVRLDGDGGFSISDSQATWDNAPACSFRSYEPAASSLHASIALWDRARPARTHSSLMGSTSPCGPRWGHPRFALLGSHRAATSRAVSEIALGGSPGRRPDQSQNSLTRGDKIGTRLNAADVVALGAGARVTE